MVYGEAGGRVMVGRFIQGCLFMVAMGFSPMLRAQVTGGVWVDADVDPCMSVEGEDVCVKVEKQDVPNSPLFAFRGEAGGQRARETAFW